jgi:hypothetical protein
MVKTIASVSARDFDIAAVAEAERQRIREIERIGHEFGLPDAARILSCETSKTPDECKKLLALLVKANEEQKSRADFGWAKAIARANRSAGYGAFASEALPGSPEKDWGRAISQVNKETGLSGVNPRPSLYNRLVPLSHKPESVGRM